MVIKMMVFVMEHLIPLPLKIVEQEREYTVK